MTLRQIVARVAGRLAAAGIETARGDAWLLLAAATGRERATLMAAGAQRHRGGGAVPSR